MEQQRDEVSVRPSDRTNKDDSDPTDAEAERDGRGYDQQPSTCQVKSTCVEDTAAEGSPEDVDDITAIASTAYADVPTSLEAYDDVDMTAFEPECIPEELYMATCEPTCMQEEIPMLILDVVDNGDDIPGKKAAAGPLGMEERIPEPTRAETQSCHATASDMHLDEDTSKVQVIRTKPLPYAVNTEHGPNTVDNVIQTEEPEQQSTINTLANAVNRVLGILDVPVVLIFGIILYLVDVGSDIAAAVSYFEKGHLGWSSLTIGIVLVSAISWAAVSWTWWYYDDEKDKHPSYRRRRMLLSVLLLDPLVR